MPADLSFLLLKGDERLKFNGFAQEKQVIQSVALDQCEGDVMAMQVSRMSMTGCLVCVLKTRIRRDEIRIVSYSVSVEVLHS